VGWSVKLFSLGGTAVRMHLTFLLLVAWIAAVQWSHAGMSGAVSGVIFILVLFACVLLHEFGHIWAARRYGIRTPDVTLLPIGGVAALERMPEKPSQEIFVALAGPAVNLVIALVLATVLGLRFDADQMSLSTLQSSFLAQIAIANIALLLFNLIPAFPMDGGRVLRALLAMRLGYAGGTMVAARIGQAVAIGFAILGFMGNPMLILIAAFIFLAAAGEAGDVRAREVTRGHSVSEAMITTFETLPVTASADDAAARMLHSAQSAFPVLDGAGRLRGIIERRTITEAVRAGHGAEPVVELMTSEVPVVSQADDLSAVLVPMQQGATDWVGVVDSGGRLVGYVTPENLREFLALEEQHAKHPGPWSRG
jgi:stage IV sporulation protein FB